MVQLCPVTLVSPPFHWICTDEAPCHSRRTLWFVNSLVVTPATISAASARLSIYTVRDADGDT